MNDERPNLPEHTRAYTDRIYAERRRSFACNALTPDDVAEWQNKARPALRELLGLNSIEADNRRHVPSVELGQSYRREGYTRHGGQIETEVGVWVPFWLLEPDGGGPFPLAITPHGHEENGYHSYVGIASQCRSSKRLRAEDRDVAVQAVREGFVAIAPATRGLGCGGVPDVTGRYGGRDCRSQLVNCLLAGRTPLGERVWDMMRIMDWAFRERNVHDRHTLMLGNSGGGMVTTHAAALDERIRIAIPSCAFSLYVKSSGLISHCDCNTIPGIMRFGEFYDVAGLIAPRHLLTVNGRTDSLHDPADVDTAVGRLRRIYEAAGAGDRYEHRYGDAGHRFYKDLMWPFVRSILEGDGA